MQATCPCIRQEYERRKRKRKRSTTEISSFVLKCSHLLCEEILFLPWTPGQNSVFTEQTIKNFISKAVAYVLDQDYESVAFPAIGCGRFGFNVDFIAQSMINHVKTEGYPLNITFVIHPNAHNVFNAFQNAAGKNGTILYHFINCFFLHKY